MLRVMTDTTELEALIARLANDESLLERGEAATRQGAINPVLRALGWDTSNLEEVDPEFSDRSGGQVDYSLRANRRDLVLLEAKRARERLDGHQDQLLGYAFRLGVQLAVLTNGLDWWLYLPMVPERTWEERRFRTVDFRTLRAPESAAELDRFLNRDRVVTGDALREAREEFESRERERRSRAALQDAWEEVLADPDGLLRDLLAKTVGEMTGHPPDPDAIVEFLRSVSGLGGPDTDPLPERSTRRRRNPRKTATAPISAEGNSDAVGLSSFTGHTPVAFWLDGDRHEVKRWKAVLQGVCVVLAAQSGERFGELVADLHGTKRVYFSRRPDDLVEPLAIANSGFFVESHFSANDCVRRAREALVAVRGSDDGFSIELAE